MARQVKIKQDVPPDGDRQCRGCNRWYSYSDDKATGIFCGSCSPRFRAAREERQRQQDRFLMEDARNGEVWAINECNRRGLDWRDEE